MFKNMGVSELCKELEPYEFDPTTVSNHDCTYQGVLQALILHPDEKIFRDVPHGGPKSPQGEDPRRLHSLGPL